MFGRQINEISEIVWRSRRSVPASIVQVEGRSSRGQEAEKLPSPSLLCVRSKSSFRMSLQLDRSGRRPTSDRRQQSSARYMGAAPTSNWRMSLAILNTTDEQAASAAAVALVWHGHTESKGMRVVWHQFQWCRTHCWNVYTMLYYFISVYCSVAFCQQWHN